MRNTRTHSKTALGSESDGELLLKKLVNEAENRGDSLQALADHLGIGYTRLAQLRRKEAQIKNSKQHVLIQAASYLRLPPLITMALAGAIRLSDFVWPAEESIEQRIAQVFEDIRQDPTLGGFLPTELASVTLNVRVFVVFLYLELRAQRAEHSVRPWLSLLKNGHRTSEEILNSENQKPATRGDSKGIF